MNGHPTPRRTAAWLSALTLVVVFTLTLACTLAFAGCRSGNEGTTVSSGATGSTPLSTDESGAVVPSKAGFPVTLTDENGNSATIKAKPMRIVSCAPSNTQILFKLGVGARVVGVSALDTSPPEVAAITKVGDYMVNSEVITSLNPDLVLGYAENEEGLGPVQKAGTPVLIFNPTTVEGLYGNIITIGAATGATVEAAGLVNEMRASIRQLADAAKSAGEKPTVFLALFNDLSTCGPGSFVDELLNLANSTNVAALPDTEGAIPQTWPVFSPEQLVASDPDIILLTTDAYASIDEFKGDPRFAGLKAVTQGRVYAVDGDLVMRPGPWIAEGLRALVQAIHPGAL